MPANRPIGVGSAALMIFTALAVDGIQAFFTFILIGLVLNPFIDLCAAAVFAIWFGHHGGKLLSKNAIGFGVTIIGELLPFISALPLWTVFIITSIVRNRVSHVVHPPPAQPASRSWRL